MKFTEFSQSGLEMVKPKFESIEGSKQKFLKENGLDFLDVSMVSKIQIESLPGSELNSLEIELVENEDFNLFPRFVQAFPRLKEKYPLVRVNNLQVGRTDSGEDLEAIKHTLDSDFQFFHQDGSVETLSFYQSTPKTRSVGREAPIYVMDKKLFSKVLHEYLLQLSSFDKKKWHPEIVKVLQVARYVLSNDKNMNFESLEGWDLKEAERVYNDISDNKVDTDDEKYRLYYDRTMPEAERKLYFVMRFMISTFDNFVNISNFENPLGADFRKQLAGIIKVVDWKNFPNSAVFMDNFKLVHAQGDLPPEQRKTAKANQDEPGVVRLGVYEQDYMQKHGFYLPGRLRSIK